MAEKPATSSIAAMEQKMREQIRLLQEQRAAAMMEEVVDLQRERDLALGRIKSLKKNMEELTMENALLKEAIGKGDLSERIVNLDRNYLEEKLVSKDLRKKLQVANKQKAELLLRVRKLEQDNTRHALSPIVLSNGRSQSMTNLTESPKPDQMGSPDSSTSNSPSENNTPKLPPSGRKTSPPLLMVNSGQATPRSGTNTPLSYSPSVIPRRYKLAAVVTRDTSTQTESQWVDPEQNQTSDIATALENARRDMLAIQGEKEKLESDLSELRSLRTKEKSSFRRECAVLRNECSVLKGSLSEFSVWTRQKMQLFEEDLDIYKVVYSLHGSLSQEKALLRDMRERLSKAETRATRLESSNTELVEELKLIEKKYKQSKAEIRRLNEVKSTPPQYYSPSSQRHGLMRNYKSLGDQSSPLVSRTSPPMKAMFPVQTTQANII